MTEDLSGTGLKTISRSRNSAPAGAIPSRIDPYSRGAIEAPHTVYRELLDAGPVVWLEKYKVLAVARFDPLRRLLKADQDFVSEMGVTMNPLLNRQAKGSDTVLVSDGAQHDRLRKVLMEPMRPRALESLRDRFRELAEERVANLVGSGPFEAMDQLASLLPVSIVAERVGLGGKDRKKMVAWSKATFNMIGPPNLRALRSFPAVLDMLLFQRQLDIDQVEPGTWIHRLFTLRDAGEIRHSEAIGMVLDYIAPSLDTTIFATGHLLYRLANNPEAWNALKADPTRVPRAVNESLRIDSVVRAFTRVAARDVDFEGACIPVGARILVVYGAANRDERRYEDPDRFDITRDARDHLAFGHGPHACAGTRLARMELEALLSALLAGTQKLHCGAPKVSNNNTLFGFDELPMTLSA